jgi:hypothetical protein
MYVEGPIISLTTSSMKVGIENGTIRLVIDTTKLAYLLHESCYRNYRISTVFQRSDIRACSWLLEVLLRETCCLLNSDSCCAGLRRKDQPICVESSRSRSERRLSLRRFLTSLFIFEEGEGSRDGWTRLMS